MRRLRQSPAGGVCFPKVVTFITEHQQKWRYHHAQANSTVCLRKSQLPDLPGNVSVRLLFHRQHRRPEDSGWRRERVSTFLINHFDLFGLRQVWLYLLNRPYNTLRFATPGPYRLVRHPLYVGWLFAFWMTPVMTLAHLLFSIATTVYILLAIRFEERDLIHEHGASYEEYRQSVPMLVPFTGKRGSEPGSVI